MICVFIFAALAAGANVYLDWCQNVIEREYDEFRTLEKLNTFNDGDAFATINSAFDELFRVEGEPKKSILAGIAQSSPDDDVYGVPIGESHAQLLTFRDGLLVNYNLNHAKLNDTMKLLQLSNPPWYLQLGYWQLGVAVLVFSVLLIGIALIFTPRRISDET